MLIHKMITRARHWLSVQVLVIETAPELTIYQLKHIDSERGFPQS